MPSYLPVFVGSNAAPARSARREEAKRKARLVTALINGLTLDNLRVPETEADRIVADLREGLRFLFSG